MSKMIFFIYFEYENNNIPRRKRIWSFIIDTRTKSCSAILSNFILLVSLPCNVEFPYANFSIIEGKKWCSYIYPINLHHIEIENSTKILSYKVSYRVSCSSHWLLII